MSTRFDADLLRCVQSNRDRENSMKSRTEDEVKGKSQEVKGKTKKELGKLNDPSLVC